MLIGASQEEHILASEALKFGPDIADGGRVDVAYMGSIIDVVDRRCDVAGLSRHGRAW